MADRPTVRLRRRLRAGIAALALLAPAPASAASIVTDWLDVALPIVEDVAPYPTTSARVTAVLHAAMFEAWAAYDERAVGPVLGGALRGTGGPSDALHKREAISHAAHAVLLAAAPHRRGPLDRFMAELGYDPDADTPAARVGREAARAVLELRRGDGANEAEGYSDGGAYAPRDASELDAWQPVMDEGEPQMAITPHWGSVMPFALPSADALRPPPPPEPGTAAFEAELEAVLALSAGLDDARKAEAEYWVPWISHPASHLMRLTVEVSFDRRLTLDEDVALFFTVSGALLDASIATWDAKYHYDYVRPETAIARLGEREVVAWASPAARAGLHLPNEGRAIAWGRAEPAVAMPARLWRPYIPTPPFPEYVSGHSAFTAAWARAMELSLGDGLFGHETVMDHLYVENRDLAEPVTIAFPTFWDAAASSGASRRHGGVHFPVSDERGLALGRAAGDLAWREAQRHVGGSARPAPSGTQLTRALWAHRPMEGAERARLALDGGLVVAAPDEPRPGMTYGGRWVSRTLDPLPAGDWRLAAEVEARGARPRVTLEGAGPPVAFDPLAEPELAFRSDGATPLRLAFEAVVDGHPGAGATLTALTLRRAP